MISAFFIDRPVFASVISIVIVLFGLMSIRGLPVEQFPNMTPPLVMVNTSYTGADAKTVAENVAAPLEQQINGVENMIYMYSQNSTTGEMALSVFFNIGTDPDMAQVNVQNRVNMALPRLPLEVQRTGVSVKKQSPNFLLIVAIQSPDGRYDDIYTSNYASINIVDELLRVEGVSDASIIGGRDYSIRIWLKPDRMAQLGISTTDVVQAVQEQNAQFAIGQIGQAPTPYPVALTIPISTKGRLSEPEEFDEIVIRANPDGSTVLLKDIARTELGAEDYKVNGMLDGKPTTLIAISQQYGANALDVGDRVKNTMQRLHKNFPAGITYSIPYDITMFIKISIKEVIKTLFEASFLVVLVVFLFLQSWRTTLIPLVALLVSIIGTLAGMYMLGFSVNMLTLFGLVLAIGIVVDDAIVVVENVERNLRELKLPPIQAAKKAMEEVTGPVIAIVFVLVAVFLPVALMGGIAGQLYKQFAITISISVILSGIVALTLSPALAALLLTHEEHPAGWAVRFNQALEYLTNGMMRICHFLIYRRVIGLSLFAGLLCVLLLFFKMVPTSFIPEEDQGYLMAFALLPDGASLDRTTAVDEQIIEKSLANPAVDHVVSLSGFSLLDGLVRTTTGSDFIILKHWDDRTAVSQQAPSVLKQLYQAFSPIQEALIFAFNPPAIMGIGAVGGFEFWLENRGEYDNKDLEVITYQFIDACKKRPELGGMTTNIQSDNLQLYVDLDRVKALSLGVPISEVFQTLQVLLGSLYINDFNKFGRVYRVMAQADPKARMTIDDIGEVYVRSNEQQMIPLKSLVNLRYSKAPTLYSRFNGFSAAKLNGNAAPGYSSGQAMNAIREVAEESLPPGVTFSWSGMSYQENLSGSSSTFALVGGVIMVFLILAALYESWFLPVPILLAIPFGLLGAIIAVWLRGISNDVYFQVGLLTLIALAAKNAILIVEFAVIKHKAGMSAIEAALEAARLRFRAILMTSLTFICGVIPLVFSTGAGAVSRQSVGTGVMGGMIAATIFVIFFVPLFYRLIWGRKDHA